MKLDLRNVSYGYDSRYPLQENVTFSLETGKVCCVLGANGSGKSTLFKAILGLIPLFRGEIEVDGTNIASLSARRLSRLMAFVPQGHNPPFPYKVKDVVMLGNASKVGYVRQPKPEDFLVAEQVMHDLGIYELRDEPYSEISGGELQLALIARALVQRPRILMLDEPTAALDYGNTLRVLGTVKKLAGEGYGILMTTHDPDHAFMCDSDVVLLRRDDFPRVGRAVDVITEKNMRQAYDVRIKVVEFVNERNEVIRRCAPVF